MTSSLSATKIFGRDVIIATLAQLVRSMRNFVLIPLIAGNLSIAHYGEWELLTTAIAFLTPWITMGLASALLRFLPGTPLNEIREGFYSVLLFAFFSCIFSICIISIVINLEHSFTSLSTLNQNYWSVSILLVSSVLLAIVQTYFRTFRKMVGHSLLMLSHHFSEGILLVYLINGGEPLSSALWFLGWMRTTLMAVGLGFIIREIGFTWPQFSNLKDYLNYSIPLMPNALFYRLYDSADRFFLYSFFGSAAVGQYAAIYIAGSLLTTMVSPIHTVLLPTMAELWNQNRRNEIAHYIEQIIRFSALVILPLLLGMAALTEPLLKLLTQQQTDLEVDNFRIICMSFAVFGFGVPWGDLLAVAGKTRLLFTLNGVLAGMNFLLNLMLVPVYGIEGAVISTFVCHSTYTLVAYYKAQRVVPFSVPWKNMFLCLIAAICSTTTLYIALLMFSIMSSIIIAVAVYIVIISIIGALETSDLRFILGILGIK